MYCTHCGAQFSKTDLYCTRCGKPKATGQPDAAVVALPQPTVALPPDLHWALVLILGWITCGIFHIVWSFVQAVWAKKLDSDNRSVPFLGAYAACAILANVLSIDRNTEAFGILFTLLGVVCFLIGVFKIRESMEQYYNSTEDIRLQLSGIMTFFFNVVYFQYHINRIARWKKTGALT